MYNIVYDDGDKDFGILEHHIRRRRSTGANAAAAPAIADTDGGGGDGDGGDARPSRIDPRTKFDPAANAEDEADGAPTDEAVARRLSELLDGLSAKWRALLAETIASGSDAGDAVREIAAAARAEADGAQGQGGDDGDDGGAAEAAAVVKLQAASRGRSTRQMLAAPAAGGDDNAARDDAADATADDAAAADDADDDTADDDADVADGATAAGGGEVASGADEKKRKKPKKAKKKGDGGVHEKMLKSFEANVKCAGRLLGGRVATGQREGIVLRDGAKGDGLGTLECASFVWCVARVKRQLWCGSETGPILRYELTGGGGAAGAASSSPGGKPLAPLTHHTGGVYCIAWARSAGCVFSGSNDFTLCQWSAAGRFLKLFAGHTNGARCALPLGPTLWSGSDDARDMCCFYVPVQWVMPCL